MDFPVCQPRARLREEIGEGVLLWLERSTAARRMPLDAESSYPCGWGTCARNVIRGGDGVLLGGCSRPRRECEDEVLTPEDAFRLEVSARTLVPVLQRALGLAQPCVDQLGVVRLGQRWFGATSVDFVLVPAPDTARPWFDEVAARDPDRRFAVIVFHRDALPAAPPANPRIVWLALSDAVPTDRGLRLPLHEVMLRLTPDAVEPGALWPPFRLVADAPTATFWWEGQPLPLATDAARHLLLAFARHPGRHLSHHELLTAAFPGDYGRKGVTAEQLRGRLRGARMKLRLALEAAQGPQIVTTSERPTSDELGVYRLDLAPGEVMVLGADLADL